MDDRHGGERGGAGASLLRAPIEWRLNALKFIGGCCNKTWKVLPALEGESALDDIDFPGNNHDAKLPASSSSRAGFMRYKEVAANLAAQNTGVVADLP